MRRALRAFAAGVTRCCVIDPEATRRAFEADPATVVRLDDRNGNVVGYIISVEQVEYIQKLSAATRLRVCRR